MESKKPDTEETDRLRVFQQAKKPVGDFGKKVIESMNASHGDVTRWGLDFLKIEPDSVVLDIGCGGGKTLERLAKRAPRGVVHGVDYSEDCVEFSMKLNKDLVGQERVVVQRASVSNLPYPDGIFDIITAVETYFFWPDLVNDLKETNRVLKNGGSLALICESYADERFKERNEEWESKAGYKNYTPGEIESLLLQSGFSTVAIHLIEENNWITAIGAKGV